MFLWDTAAKEPITERSASAPISSACQMTPDVFAASGIDGSYTTPPPPPLPPLAIPNAPTANFHNGFHVENDIRFTAIPSTTCARKRPLLLQESVRRAVHCASRDYRQRHLPLQAVVAGAAFACARRVFAYVVVGVRDGTDVCELSE